MKVELKENMLLPKGLLSLSMDWLVVSLEVDE